MDLAVKREKSPYGMREKINSKTKKLRGSRRRKGSVTDSCKETVDWNGTRIFLNALVSVEMSQNNKCVFASFFTFCNINISDIMITSNYS